MFCFGDPRQTTMIYEVTSPTMEINKLIDAVGAIECIYVSHRMASTLTKGWNFKMNFVQNNDTKSLNLRK